MEISSLLCSFMKISAAAGIVLSLIGIYCIFAVTIPKSIFFLFMILFIFCIFFCVTAWGFAKKTQSTEYEKCMFCSKEHEKGFMYCPFCGTAVQKEPESIEEREKQQTHKDLIGLAKSRSSMDGFFEDSAISEPVDDSDTINVKEATQFLPGADSSKDEEEFFN